MEVVLEKYHRFIYSSDPVSNTNAYYFQIPTSEIIKIKDGKLIGDYKLDFVYYNHFVRIWIQIVFSSEYDCVRATSFIRLVDETYPEESSISVLIANDDEMTGYSYDKSIYPYTRKYKLSHHEFSNKKVIVATERNVKLSDFLYISFHLDLNVKLH